MARSKPDKTGSVAVHVRLQPEAFAIVQAWNDHLSEERPGENVTIGATLHSLIAKAGELPDVKRARKSV